MLLAATEPAGQSVGATEPVAQEEPGGHAKHCDACVRLVALENVPAGHCSAVALPLGQ